MLWGSFSSAGFGELVRENEKLGITKYRGILIEDCLSIQDRGRVLPFSRMKGFWGIKTQTQILIG